MFENCQEMVFVRLFAWEGSVAAASEASNYALKSKNKNLLLLLN